MSQRVLSPAAIEYPSGDGKPMAEDDWQRWAILDSFAALDFHFRDRPDVYVSGDLFIYYEEGNPHARVAPDVFVAFGVPKHNRHVYKLWEERVVPAFVMEVASRGTWREHDGPNAKLYERLGVREYWQYDPTGGYLGLHLKGRRLVEGRYEPQPVVESLDGSVLLRSDALGLDGQVKGEEMWFVDLKTGQRILKTLELDEARRNAESRAEDAESRTERETAARRDAEARAGEEAAARRAAEARIAELEALLREERR